MKKTKRCCFAGHREIWDSGAKDRIKKAATALITNQNVTEFWVGNYGTFDSYAAAAIRELQITFPQIRLDLVIPYITKKINEFRELYYKKCDNILVANIPENTPRRFLITKTNEFMVNHSDFLICYIQHSWGGAMTTYAYAKRKNLKIFNVAETPIEQ